MAILEAASTGPHPMAYYRQRAWGAICNHATRHLRAWRALACLDDFGSDDVWHRSPHNAADPERIALEIVVFEQRLSVAQLTRRQLAALMSQGGSPSTRAARKRARARIRLATRVLTLSGPVSGPRNTASQRLASVAMRGRRPGVRDESG